MLFPIRVPLQQIRRHGCCCCKYYIGVDIDETTAILKKRVVEDSVIDLQGEMTVEDWQHFFGQVNNTWTAHNTLTAVAAFFLSAFLACFIACFIAVWSLILSAWAFWIATRVMIECSITLVVVCLVKAGVFLSAFLACFIACFSAVWSLILSAWAFWIATRVMIECSITLVVVCFVNAGVCHRAIARTRDLCATQTHLSCQLIVERDGEDTILSLELLVPRKSDVGSDLGSTTDRSVLPTNDCCKGVHAAMMLMVLQALTLRVILLPSRRLTVSARPPSKHEVFMIQKQASTSPQA
jgi:hypothetical protein